VKINVPGRRDAPTVEASNAVEQQFSTHPGAETPHLVGLAGLSDIALELPRHELPHDPGEVKARLLQVPAGADEVELDSGEHRSAISGSDSSTGRDPLDFGTSTYSSPFFDDFE
jgi:hypothetical protein